MKLKLKASSKMGCICYVSIYCIGPANRVSTTDARTNPQTNGSNTGFKPRGREFSFGKFIRKFSFMVN